MSHNFQKTNQMLAGENKSLHTENEMLKSALVKLREELSVAQAERTEAQHLHERLLDDYNLLNESHNLLKAEREKAEESIISLTNLLTSRNEEIAKLRGAMPEAKAE